jgi:hypothetical protein
MNRANLLILVPLLFFFLSVQAQHRGGPDFEKFKSQKIAFLTEKMNLSPKEAQNFWPVYNQYEKDRMDIQHKRRELEQKTRDESLKMTDQEIIQITREIAATFKTEAELTTGYNEKFLKLLPPQKVLQLYRAENQFRAHMFEQYRKKEPEPDSKKE